MYSESKKRASELLEKLSLDEKIYQVTSDLLFDVEEGYETRRDPLFGSYRNPGHFMHYKHESAKSPREVAERINNDIRLSIDAQPHSIPPIENGEALHGAQWGMATCFPQPIALASTFDDELVSEVADVIGKETASVGVRQVFAPVVNLSRDPRWGRTVETFGEDVCLSSKMGAAMCRGFQKNGVIATPKHFADNYAAGGRDSNYSETSERTMRETILPPFKACFDAGAMSVMVAYNAWDGIPCTASRRLLTEILRNEWGFSGFVVSDYIGAQGVYDAHGLYGDISGALAASLKAGLDIILPFDSFDDVKKAIEDGKLSEEELDRNVLRILTAKFEIGLFDDPFASPEAAEEIVRCEKHKALALKAAEKSIVLLKNDGILPLNKQKTKKIGVFGESAKLIPVGSNYSGPYGTPWTGEDAPTPLEALMELAGDNVEIVFGETSEIENLAPECDINIFFTSVIEGEGSDRSSLRLPGITRTRAAEGEGFIVDNSEQTVTENQEDTILRLAGANKRLAVVLLNGAPVEMGNWLDEVPAVLEAWYPGEQGARAIAKILFGLVNPSAKLPITFPKSAGQLPLFYAHKPSGRGYAYCDDDGKPLFPFGFGLSYTNFAFKNPSAERRDGGTLIAVDVLNEGECDGEEVVQLYLSSKNTKTVLPVKELKAFKRVFIKSGESARVEIFLTDDIKKYYDENMDFDFHGGDFSVLVGNSSENTPFEVKI